MNSRIPTFPRCSPGEVERYLGKLSGPLLDRIDLYTEVPPLEFEDQGQPAGIAVDYLRSISEKTGLTFEFVPADSTAQLDQMAAAGEVEMIAGMTYDYDLAQKRNLGMTRVYLNSQFVAVLNKRIDETNLSGKVMALSENS